MFYVMKDATVCLSEKNKIIAFNGMCYTLHEKWNVEKPVLGKLMDDFGYVYMETCYNCGNEYEWDNLCQSCIDDLSELESVSESDSN